MTASSVDRCPLKLIKCIRCEKSLECILTSQAFLLLTKSDTVNNLVIEEEEKCPT